MIHLHRYRTSPEYVDETPRDVKRWGRDGWQDEIPALAVYGYSHRFIKCRCGKTVEQYKRGNPPVATS